MKIFPAQDTDWAGFLPFCAVVGPPLCDRGSHAVTEGNDNTSVPPMKGPSELSFLSFPLSSSPTVHAGAVPGKGITLPASK